MNLAHDLARRIGWPWAQPTQPEPAAAADPAVYVDWLQLTALEHSARRVRWPPQTASSRSLLAGRHGSRVRGRGLDFIELRQYLPGDDTRAIDWRASARTGRTVAGSPVVGSSASISRYTPTRLSVSSARK